MTRGVLRRPLEVAGDARGLHIALRGLGWCREAGVHLGRLPVASEVAGSRGESQEASDDQGWLRVLQVALGVPGGLASSYLALGGSG
jgi:hypothetical protein